MLKTIKIIFEDENQQVIVKGEAHDVLNAEGELQRLARAYMKNLEDKKRIDPRCTCGDTESEHIDSEAQCVIVDCGCKEFESRDDTINENGEDHDICPNCKKATPCSDCDNCAYCGTDGSRNEINEKVL